MTIGLTQRQLDLLRFIERYHVENDGRGPSYEEMKHGIGLAARSGVHRLISGLEERGFVTRLPNCSRAIRLAQDSYADLSAVPLPAIAQELKRRGFAIVSTRRGDPA